MIQTVESWVDGHYVELTRNADGKYVVPAGATVLSLPSVESTENLPTLPAGLKALWLGGRWITGEELEQLKEKQKIIDVNYGETISGLRHISDLAKSALKILEENAKFLMELEDIAQKPPDIPFKKWLQILVMELERLKEGQK